jgi:hypothetical protein
LFKVDSLFRVPFEDRVKEGEEMSVIGVFGWETGGEGIGCVCFELG